ncbi:MAG: nitrate reductase cytochrome c-type subunit [Thiovulaceae bacterium]|nr:nitrate reductase cytochrome c-type subunit [Sulfurimonadaceae bacterium]
MKTISKMTISLAATVLLIVGCSSSSTKPSNEMVLTPTISEESLGYRDSSIYTEDNTSLPAPKYSDAAAGTSKKIPRAFQDAPPMIPHDTEGLLPIEKGNNQCLSCHMPDVAPSVGATPIPASHFMDMRPHDKIVNGTFEKAVDNMKNEVSIKKIGDLYQGRFNCSQCHAPQSDAKLVTESKFKAEYLSPDGASKSHWSDVMRDHLDTVGKDSSVTQKDIENDNSLAGQPLHGH